MAQLMRFHGKIEECEILNTWIKNRFARNKNILMALTGSTGSSKSYDCIQICDKWYQYNFKESFPVETHICFSIEEVMRLLNSKKLRKGELIIIEEAGVLLNSLDFQNKISKLFTFVLQSFRSMNIGLVLNLPVLSMLNKSTRLLLHAHFITFGIDFEKKIAKVKPFFNQLNQMSGKIYPKYLWIRMNGKAVQVKRMNFSMPDKALLDVYEKKKLRFVSNLNQDFVDELRMIDDEAKMKLARTNLTDAQQEVFNYLRDGFNVKQISEKRQTTTKSIYETIKYIKKKGFDIKISKKPKENQDIKG